MKFIASKELRLNVAYAEDGDGVYMYSGGKGATEHFLKLISFIPAEDFMLDVPPRRNKVQTDK